MQSSYWLSDAFPKRSHFLKALLLLATLFLGEQVIQTVWLAVIRYNGTVSLEQLPAFAMSYPWSLLLVTLLWLVIFIYLLKKAGLPLFQKVVINRHHLTTLAGGFMAIMAIQIIGSMIVTYFYPDQLVSLNQQVLNESMQMMTFPRMVVAFCVLAPIEEEIMMRGLIMRYMFPKHPWVGMFVSALIFASLHLTTLWIHFLIYFGMGFVLAFIYYKTGRLEYAIGGHFLNNLISILPTIA